MQRAHGGTLHEWWQCNTYICLYMSYNKFTHSSFSQTLHHKQLASTTWCSRLSSKAFLGSPWRLFLVVPGAQSIPWVSWVSLCLVKATWSQGSNLKVNWKSLLQTRSRFPLLLWGALGLIKDKGVGRGLGSTPKWPPKPPRKALQ